MRRTYKWERGTFAPLCLSQEWPSKVKDLFDAWLNVARRDYPGFQWVVGAEARTVERICASNAATEADVVEIMRLSLEDEFDAGERAYCEGEAWSMRDA